jgi:protein-disulfide isomerase
MDTPQTKKEDMLIPDIQVKTMSSSNTLPGSNNIRQSAQVSASTNLGQTSPMQDAVNARPLGVPGMNIDPNLASRVNQSNSLPRKLNIKMIVILSVSLLLVGSLAYAWFFTDLKYKLPWFRASEDKLVGMMYDNLAKLDGADFALTYKLSVGDRDKDVVVDEKKVSDSEVKARRAAVQSQFSMLVSDIILCSDNQGSIQAFGGQLCDGSQAAMPKVGEKICSSSPVSSETLSDLYGREANIWPDLSEYDWSYDNNCQFSASNYKWSFSAHSNYNEDKVVCTENGCTRNDENLMGFENEDSSMNLDLLFSDYLGGMEDYISTNFSLEATLSGSGFSLKERADEKKQLPDVGVGFDGKAELGSMSGKVKLDARVVDDAIFYMVSDFPFTDITEGYEDQWIKVGTDDDMWVNRFIPRFSEEQNQAIVDFRNFVAKTKDYNVLAYKFAGNYIEKDGLKAPIFEVTLIPENVPSWLQDLRNLYTKNQTDDATLKIEEKQYTEEEKVKIIAKSKELMSNMKIKAALHPGTGDLINLTVDFRIIPSADSKKFANKQFNSTLSVDLWNHNKPTAPKVPDSFVEQSEIEREKLGYSKEAYQDIQQSQRITRIRQDLLSYYNENQAWPQKLSDASKSIIDYNTGKEYPYQVVGSNYIITYQMFDVEQKAKPKQNDYYYDRGINGFGSNSLTQVKELWDKGENKADRYSPVAHKYASSHNWLIADTQASDSDILQSLYQAKMVKALGDKLTSFYSKNKRYPETLSELDGISTFGDYDLLDSYSYRTSSASKKRYHCEDLVLAKPCEYQKQGADAYLLKVNYKLSLNNISQDLVKYNQYNMVAFTAGLNQYDASSINRGLSTNIFVDEYADTDKDGLTNAQEKLYGTNSNNKDTDGDGFYDGEEVKSGYNPNGSGKLNEVMVNNGGIQYAPITSSDWVKGDSKATVSLIIYSDADCPFCKNFHETSNQILKDYAGKVKVVYRHFPLASLHPEAPKKAEAIECIGELGGNTKVWLFLDKLFVTNKPTLAQLGDTATAVGVDKTKFQTCLDSGKYASKVSTQASGAQTAGAQGTPYSLLIQGINVIPVNGAQPIAEMKNKIDSLLK